jgi:hypothetical protein
MSTPSSSHTPPRSLILAVPVGTYVTITRAPENGWGPAALIGALLLVLILWGPTTVRAGARSMAVRSAAKKAKKKEAEK